MGLGKRLRASPWVMADQHPRHSSGMAQLREGHAPFPNLLLHLLASHFALQATEHDDLCSNLRRRESQNVKGHVQCRAETN